MFVPNTVPLFTAYLGPVVIPGIIVDADNTLAMQVVVEDVVVRCIDAAANHLTAETVMTIKDLPSLPTMRISVTENRFYGLVCALVWAKVKTVSEERQWWVDLFDREIGLDRTLLFTRAHHEFPAAFSMTELTQDTGLVVLLRQLCVKLSPVDCLHHVAFFPTFQRDCFGTVNVAHLTTLPVLCNVPDLQDAAFSKTYIIVGNGKTDGSLPFCSMDILAHELGHGVVRGQ
jgi:hypothetical protein